MSAAASRDPVVVLVTGLPATGKTTLARRLAADLRLPLFAKDDFKETLFDTLGVRDRAWSRQLGIATMRLLHRALEAGLRSGRSCILEAPFSPEYDAPRIEALRQTYDFTLVQVLCITDGPTLLERYMRRAASEGRHSGHDDRANLDEWRVDLLRGRADPLPIAGILLEVDTTDFAAMAYENVLAAIEMLRRE